jgi:hypothetical protein
MVPKTSLIFELRTNFPKSRNSRLAFANQRKTLPLLPVDALSYERTEIESTPLVLFRNFSPIIRGGAMEFRRKDDR